MHGNSKKVGFTINALKDYNPSYGNHSTSVQQPRFTLFGNIKSVPESKVRYMFITIYENKFILTMTYLCSLKNP